MATHSKTIKAPGDQNEYYLPTSGIMLLHGKPRFFSLEWFVKYCGAPNLPLRLKQEVKQSLRLPDISPRLQDAHTLTITYNPDHPAWKEYLTFHENQKEENEEEGNEEETEKEEEKKKKREAAIEILCNWLTQDIYRERSRQSQGIMVVKLLERKNGASTSSPTSDLKWDQIQDKIKEYKRDIFTPVIEHIEVGAGGPSHLYSLASIEPPLQREPILDQKRIDLSTSGLGGIFEKENIEWGNRDYFPFLGDKHAELQWAAERFWLTSCGSYQVFTSSDYEEWEPVQPGEYQPFIRKPGHGQISEYILLGHLGSHSQPMWGSVVLRLIYKGGQK